MEQSAAPSGFTFSYRFRVRWAEVDRQGVVFNPHYFAYADLGCTEYFRAIGFPYPEGLESLGCDLYAVSAQGNFRGSARYDDELELAYRTALLGRTSVRFETRIDRGDALLFEGALVYVCVDLRSRAPAALPAELVECICAFERTPPGRKIG
jgi:acyl-CoA thioester hydrolase